MDESSYSQGHRMAWRQILGEAIRQLGPDGSSESWRTERADAIAALRTVCEEYGDNEWPDDLHLGDIIEKHLTKHLFSGETE